MITSCVAALPLAIAGWQDVKKREIPLFCIVFLLILSVVRVVLREGTALSAVSGLILMGGPLLLMAVLLDGGQCIGGGDVKLCAALGALLGPLDCLMLLAMAAVLLAAVALILRKNVMPFAPFVAAAYCINLLLWR
ncbi:MAG: prepilin peptidase [Oscillospiraceae bacterium]